MSEKARSANMMTATERDDLIAAGWHVEVVESLRVRGFRPCKPDYVSARFEGIDISRTMGFLRQTALPHLHITVPRYAQAVDVMEAIDTAIAAASRREGHEALAGQFMRFFEQCRNWKPSPDLAALESRLSALEQRTKNEAP